MLPNPLSGDLEHILEHTGALWNAIRNKRIFITGGTGFIGCWLLECFIWANEKLSLKAEAVVLTRNKRRFLKKCPNLYHNSAVNFIEGDIKSFDFPEGNFTQIIHGAASVSMQAQKSQFDDIVEGTRRIMEFSQHCGAERLLVISSGAVYRMQSGMTGNISEEYPCQTDFSEQGSSYAQGKFLAEKLACEFAQQHSLNVMVARCFSFCGPYFPLDAHFAIGNFIGDGIHGNDICIEGDGTAVRSYLYASDLMIWLWTILFKGRSMRPYNVGSGISISVADLARMVAESFHPTCNIQFSASGAESPCSDCYVPSIERGKHELGLNQTVNLRDALHKTIEWYKSYLKKVDWT